MHRVTAKALFPLTSLALVAAFAVAKTRNLLNAQRDLATQNKMQNPLTTERPDLFSSSRRQRAQDSSLLVTAFGEPVLLVHVEPRLVRIGLGRPSLWVSAGRGRPRDETIRRPGTTPLRLRNGAASRARH